MMVLYTEDEEAVMKQLIDMYSAEYDRVVCKFR